MGGAEIPAFISFDDFFFFSAGLNDVTSANFNVFYWYFVLWWKVLETCKWKGKEHTVCFYIFSPKLNLKTVASKFNTKH